MSVTAGGLMVKAAEKVSVRAHPSGRPSLTSLRGAQEVPMKVIDRIPVIVEGGVTNGCEIAAGVLYRLPRRP